MTTTQTPVSAASSASSGATGTDRERVVTALAGFATLPDWLAAGMDPDRVAASLRRHVPELRTGRPELIGCAADRLRAKEDQWLARYTLTVAGPEGPAREVVLVGRLWPPFGEPAPDEPTGPPAARFGDPAWHCWLPDLRLGLQVQEHDEALPSLPRLVEPQAAAELLEPILRRAGYEATIATCEPQVVRYKPGSRCTVVVRLTYDGPDRDAAPNPVVLKTHQGDKGEAAWKAMRALWARPESWRGHVRLAEPLGFLAEDRVLVQGPVPEERTLKELAREAVTTRQPARLDELRTELTRTARALAAMHGSGATYGRTATFGDELAEVAEVVDRLSSSAPQLEAAAEPLLEWFAETDRDVTADPVVSAHHDFRPAQVLLHRSDIGFIDFDGACMAEPALDLGRFRAKFRDIGISTLTPDDLADRARVDETLGLLDELCAGFLDAYLETAPVTPARVLLWETCDLMTTMLHAWTKVRLARVEPRLELLRHAVRTGPVV
jgi:hypothetical protein